MNCEMVNSLLLSYCDNELNPYLRQEVEKHLADCRRCADLAHLIQLENQALRMKQDIPEPRSDLQELICQKVLKEAPRQGSETTVRGKSIKAWGEKRFAGLLVAVLLIAWVGLWSIANIITSDDDQPPRTAGFRSHSLPTTMQQPSLPTKSNTSNEKGEQGIRDRNRTAGAEKPVWEQGITETKKSQAPEEKISPFVYPSYVPDGFKLISVVSDSENRLTITYADDLDHQIILKVWPEGGENVNAITGAMVSAKTTVPDNLTTMSLSVTREDARYFVQLQGNIPAQEMAKMANSLSWHD